MPPLTVTIPPSTLAVGASTFGPATVDNELAQATLTIDRTIVRGGTQGFNGQPSTTRATLAVEQSNNGGTTWFPLAAIGISGGPSPDSTVSQIQVALEPGTGRRVRAVVTVSGDKVAVAGSLTAV